MLGELYLEESDLSWEVESCLEILSLAKDSKDDEKIIYDRLMKSALEKNRLEENYEENVSQSCSEYLAEFGITEEEVDFELKEKVYIRSFIEGDDSIISKNIDSEIGELLLKKFDDVYRDLEIVGDFSDNAIGEKPIELMTILNFVSKNLPNDDAHANTWASLNRRFDLILGIKSSTESEVVQEKIDEAFRDYQSFIDDGIFHYRWNIEGGSGEDLSSLLYGKSLEELENTKVQNRKNVSKKLTEISQKVMGPEGEPLEVDMILELYRVNNEGVVPQHLSHLRMEEVVFGKRVGVISSQVQPAVGKVIKKADQLIKNPPTGPFASLRYSIEVAKLHNKLLDIHPFMDRNGSTCLLFVELLMAARGKYMPPPTRVKNYNKNLLKILGSPIAFAIVSYEHYKIMHRFGHYKSKSLELDEATITYYKESIEERREVFGEPDRLHNTLDKMQKNLKKFRKAVKKKKRRNTI